MTHEPTPESSQQIEHAIKTQPSASIRRWTVFSIAGFLIAAALVAAVVAPRFLRKRAALSVLLHPDCIELYHGLGSYADAKAVITDPAEIRALVRTIKLVPKERCACAHEEFAEFIRGDQYITISLCPHCFDICQSRVSGLKELSTNNEMPPGFYAAFSAYVGNPANILLRSATAQERVSRLPRGLRKSER